MCIEVTATWIASMPTLLGMAALKFRLFIPHNSILALILWGFLNYIFQQFKDR